MFYSLTTDCFPLAVLKQNVGGQKLKDDGDVETVVTDWLLTRDTDRYQQEVECLLSRYRKRLSCGGDYVEN